jgi:DNA polymerase-3 subunit gamma/tau
MSYIALARKWRPRTFSQLVGQEHINKALSNSLNKNRLHHAYLFTGTRGVGKTSVARLLAKALNCEKGISAEPCLQCEACLSIEQGRFIDLIEIDGASRTRVEDTRELLENVQYVPTNGRFKIYLIDEVHMLSQHSFNALLKTLEEPPAHVKFLLATTDPQKLPVTVLSRCLQFNLKHLQADVICRHLEHILNDEQLPYDIAALELLAKAARGSMRDALSLLDQTIASSDNHIHTQDVKNILGYTQQDYALQLLQALADADPQQLMAISKKITDEGGHYHYVVDEILSYLHQMSICQSISNNNPLISTEPEIIALSTRFKPEDTQLFYQIGVKGTEELHLAPTLAIGFEMMLLRMYTFRPASKVAMPPLAYQMNQASTAAAPAAIPVAAPIEAPIYIEEPSQVEEPSQESASIEYEQLDTLSAIDLNLEDQRPEPENELITPKESPVVTPAEPMANKEDNAETDWSLILPQLNLSGLALNAAENSELISKSGAQVILRVAKGHLSVFTAAVIKRIEQGLATYYKEVIKLKLRSDEPVLSSPAQQRKITQEKMHEDAESALQSDPFFQQLQEEFSAEVVKNSIVPLKDDL